MAQTTLRYSETPAAHFRKGVVCIGNFDGVHRGHGALLAEARQVGSPVVAVTFDPHPLTLLAPTKYQPPLTTIADRATLLQSAGADHVVILQTTPELLALSPEYFFETIIVQALQAQGVVEGFNFRFGHQRAGDNVFLQQACAALRMTFQEVAAYQVGGAIVSSSKVREAVLAGDMEQAQMWLARPYQSTGIVQVGAQRGRTLGFPTANLGSVTTLLPMEGVYAVRSVIGERTFWGAANVGPNPTFGEHTRKLEVHFLDYAGDLYGSTRVLEWHTRIRPIRPFATIDALREQIQQDVATVRAWATNPPKRG